ALGAAKASVLPTRQILATNLCPEECQSVWTSAGERTPAAALHLRRLRRAAGAPRPPGPRHAPRPPGGVSPPLAGVPQPRANAAQPPDGVLPPPETGGALRGASGGVSLGGRTPAVAPPPAPRKSHRPCANAHPAPVATAPASLPPLDAAATPPPVPP